MAKRARITDDLLGRRLRGHDALIPEHQNVMTSPEPHGKVGVQEKEPTTVRFSRPTLKLLDHARATLFADRDLRVTRSEMIEAAVRSALKDIDSLQHEIGVLRTEEV